MEKLSGYAFVGGTIALALATLIFVAYLLSGVRSARMATAGVGTTTRVGFFAGPLAGSLGQYGNLFTWLGFLALSAGLIFRTIATGHGPFANQYEFSIAFAWGIAGAFLWFERKYHQRGVALVALPVALGMMLYALLFTPSTIEPLVPALQNNLLLTVHVAMAIVAYGSFTIAFATALLYLSQSPVHWGFAVYSLLTIPAVFIIGWWALIFLVPAPVVIARGITVGAGRVIGGLRLPRLEMLDEIGYRAIVVGFPFLTLTIILGALWADQAWGKYWSWDPKETASLVTWLFYGAYLHARVMRGWRGNKAAVVLYSGFFFVILTYFGNLFFNSLHSYAGLG